MIIEKPAFVLDVTDWRRAGRPFLLTRYSTKSPFVRYSGGVKIRARLWRPEDAHAPLVARYDGRIRLWRVETRMVEHGTWQGAYELRAA